MKITEKAFFDALCRIASAINVSGEAVDILEKIVKIITDTMEVKATSIRVVDEKKRVLLMGAAYGLTKGYIKKGPVLIKESGIDQRVLKGETVLIKDAQADPDFQYSIGAGKEGIRTVLVLPLSVDKKIIGVLRVYTDKARDFSEDDKKFLEAAADMSSIAIENGRIYLALQGSYDLIISSKYKIDEN